MDKDKSIESVFEMRELDGKVAKFISVTASPQSLQVFTHWLVRISRHRVITSDNGYYPDTLKLMAILAMAVLAAAAVTA